MATTTRNGTQYEPTSDEDSEVRKHLSIPTYAPFGSYYTVSLQKNSYTARDLLNHTVIAFYLRRDNELSRRQIIARGAFAARFRKWKNHYGQKVILASLPNLQEDILFLANRLDEFFFFKCLGPHVRIDSGFDVVGENLLGIEKIEGETFPYRGLSQEYTQIKINIGSDGRLYELNAIVGQLIHEMVHAYLRVFVCDCPKCTHNILNTVSASGDGHGPMFLMLHRLILTEMRTWGENDIGNDGLKALLAEDCPELSVSKNARARAKVAKDHVDKCHTNMFRELDSNLGNSAIELGPNGDEVIVSPSLKNKQMDIEDSLRAREKEYYNDMARYQFTEKYMELEDDVEYEEVDIYEMDWKTDDEESSHASGLW
ncbi:hypothetical protein F4677DRAFT_459831 [Hypoxylon crocopeplum]|nr:hypothetical protein F4677DRAFT_459831 [Hypoxylon crocopeplum]